MEVKKILCAVDLSDASADVAEYACSIALALEAKVIVLYTAPSLSQYLGFHVSSSTIDGFVGEIAGGAAENMKNFVDEHFPGVQAEGRVVVGYAAEEIVRCAKSEECGMVVMGTHGRKGLDRIIFGSVAEKVVQNSTIPVLTIRPASALPSAEK